MNSQVRLKTKDILEKEFKTALKGYNQEEVDKFLDLIIQDYEMFEKIVEQLEYQNQQLQKDMKKLSEKTTRQSPAPIAAGNTNYDILQRLSNLEKKVFGSKLYE
ncbi:cell division regulator GpsB [Bacillus sp. FJAT-45350]|uniref:cell division regulator GpsB n=1 Tax=Bacillus sp. FJAT-45350 TaxID=2011014 RepID=UPI000BB8B14A|nr:cell division regulator GpsB [Bacillus sp. FJAT-45350]